ncbi:hypothetical protein C0581_03365 [Candidatus Parcubacteria bacterium]|nr:MAG: hypothetical protein C0581_03365 [Candidatus Parcubacteria bacterium]
MTKKIKKKETKPQEIDLYKPKEFREEMVKLLTSEITPDEVLKKLHEFLAVRKNIKGKQKEFSELADKAIRVVGLDNHMIMAEIVTQNREFAIEFANQLIQEYDCKTPSEKSLAQMVAGSYCKYLEYSRLFNNSQRVEWLSSEKNGYYNLLSKEVDRSHRHYLSSLTTLRQIKSPEIKVNVKANTAFVAQNQQLNKIEETKKHQQ